jgi:hypothetical protein
MAANKLTKLDNLIRGDTPLLTFTFNVGTALVDLTGYVITFTATSAQNPDTSDIPVIKVSVNGDTTGIASFQLLNDQTNNNTSNLGPGTTYYFDVQIFNNQSGILKRIMTPVRGTFSVDADYNRTDG